MTGRLVFLTVLKRPAALTAAAMFGLLIGSDWIPGLHSFWEDHSMTTNVVSSVVFVFFTLWIVEDVIDETLSRRWRRARRAAHRALAEMCLESRLRLTVCVDGFDLRLRAITPPPPNLAAIEAILSRHQLPVHNAVPVAPFAQDDLERWRSRFATAVTDPQWLDQLIDETRAAKRVLWEEIAGWSSVMLSDSGSAELLNEVARLADAILAAEQSVGDIRLGRESERASEAVDRLLEAVTRSPAVIDRLAATAGWRGSLRRAQEPRRDADLDPT